TEDLFYWDNDIYRKLKIQPNKYTKWVLWVLIDQGKANDITYHFQRYTSDKLTLHFNGDFSEVHFSFERGDDESSECVKISKEEESCFIWSIFYSLLEVLKDIDGIGTDEFNDLEYVFIDDPVSSLDDNHLIKLAVDIAELIKSNQSDLKFIITT